MNWNHLQATIWLRWRILVNRVRRARALSNAVFGLLVVVGLLITLGLFVLGLAMGLELLPEAEPRDILLTWVVLAVAFCFFWMIGLVVDLQRSDAMSFKNLLHLPVSLGWVFLYNYLSSFVSLSVAIFLPAMLGLCLAMVIVEGPLMLLGLPLLLGFFGMITAITYQIRGWLAQLMENKRRGRNIIAAITVVFVLLLQAPNLINLSLQSSTRTERRAERSEVRHLQEVAKAEGPEQSAAQAELARRDELSDQEDAVFEHYVMLGARWIPVGWLPYGMRATVEGHWLAGGACALGMLLISTWSLRRSFRSTMRSIVGTGSAGDGAAGAEFGADPEQEAEAPGAGKPSMVERSLPLTSEGVAGVALASLRSLLRAPEAKLLLLSPVILLGLFAFMLSDGLMQRRLGPFGASMSLGATAMGLLSIFQLIQNQFGLDRAGFRAYVLSPMSRQQILAGKNLAIAPLGLGTGLAAMILLQFMVPVDGVHLLGGLLQILSAYLLLCMVGNLISILGPMRLKENALKAANPNIKIVLWQILSMLLIPLTLAPLLIPATAEFFLGGQSWARHVPIFLVLHAAALTAIFLAYRWLLRRQGELLQEREQRILEVLTRD